MAEEEDIDAYMENGDILDFLPKEEELLEEDIFKISADIEQDHDRFLDELPKFRRDSDAANHNTNFDATMTTDHTTDDHEHEYDEEELHIIASQKEEKEEKENTNVVQPESELSPNQRNQTSKEKSQNPLTSSVNEAEGGKTRIYQHPVSKPKFVAGRRHLSIAEARLFGLLSEDGELVDLKADKTVPPEEKLRNKMYLLQMAQPKTAQSPSEKELLEKEGCTFAPQKDAQAIQAMKNKRCGYDFMDRINNRGSFLDRVSQLSGGNKGAIGKVSKAEYEAMKRDYDESLTKLQCPKCLKFQSFDEFINKKRVCTLCNLKFQKLHISSGSSFLRKNQDYEKKRREKLENIEKEMYGEVFAKKTPPQLPPRGDEAINSEPLPSRPHQPRSATQRIKPPFPPRQQQSHFPNKTQNIAMDANRSALERKEEKIDSKQVLAKIISLNSSRNQQAMHNLEHIQQQLSDPKPASTANSDHNSTSRKAKGATPSRETVAAELPHISKPKTKMSDKMERLFST